VNKVPLSVTILAKNEEKNITECLESVVNWADEVMVIDDESTDRTAELAQRLGAKVFHRRMENEGKHRNWAYAQARNEWVLSLDADETVTKELQEEIRQSLKEGKFESFSIPIKTYIGKFWVKHCGWYPANKLRMFMKSKQWYEEVEVHPRVANFITCGLLTKDIIHKGYPNFAHFIDGLNRQTTLEARKWIRDNRQVSLAKAIWKMLDRFFRTFLGKAGFKDGFVGFMVSYFAGAYQIISYAKYREMKRSKAKTK